MWPCAVYVSTNRGTTCRWVLWQMRIVGIREEEACRSTERNLSRKSWVISFYYGPVYTAAIIASLQRMCYCHLNRLRHIHQDPEFCAKVVKVAAQTRVPLTRTEQAGHQMRAGQPAQPVNRHHNHSPRADRAHAVQRVVFRHQTRARRTSN